jgi:hypothetical protein
MVREAGLGGVAIGVLVFAWQVLTAAVSPGTSLFIPIATGIELGILVGLLSRNVARPYSERFTIGAGASALSAILVFAGSLLVTQVLFPGLLEQLPGHPTAVSAAGGGLMGTLVTGVAFSAVFPAILRRPPA